VLLPRSRSFKVTDVGTNRKTVCDFLLVINSNGILSRTVLKLSQIVVSFLDTLRFRAPFGGLGSTYTIHLRLIGKRVVDFLVVLTKVFSLAVTAEAPYE